MSFEFVAVGTSLGGFHALTAVLGGLPPDFPLPIAVVQHRSNMDSDGLAPLLGRYTQIPVVEVEDKEAIEQGRIYVCPPNYHLLVDGAQFALSTDGPVLYARPSIDVLFESAAESFREGVIGLLLTGMSRDGAAGLRKIKEVGGYAVVQDPAAAEGDVMPRAAIDCVAVDKVLPLENIASFLTALCACQRTEV
jgi:two-component system, chemotaxis family, protein-glutamate methylesterase/glutaminase